MDVKELKEKYPLVRRALSEIGADNCGMLNPHYSFPDTEEMVAELSEAEATLKELVGRTVSDVITMEDVKAQCPDFPWDVWADEMWDDWKDNDAFEMAVISEASYMEALSAATSTGGEVLQSLLNHCFDGVYSTDAKGNELYVPYYSDEEVIGEIS